MVIHLGTKDLTNVLNKTKNVKKWCRASVKLISTKKIKLLSLVLSNREDNNFAEKIQECNTKLESCCKSRVFVFINNSELDSSSLNRGWLHLNRKGTGLLSRNLLNVLKIFEYLMWRWFIEMIFQFSLINLDQLKKLRLGNTKKYLVCLSKYYFYKEQVWKFFWPLSRYVWHSYYYRK